MPDVHSEPCGRPALVCVGTEAAAARALALAAAELLACAEATVLSVWAPEPVSHNPVAAIAGALFEDVDAANDERREAAIAAAAAARVVLTAAGWTVTTRIVCHKGDRWAAQAQVARELDPSVVVTGEPSERVRDVCSQETRSLAHHLRAPLLVAPAPAPPPPAAAPVLAAFDGSDGARRALAAATTLLAPRPVEVVCAWTAPRTAASIAASGAALAVATPDSRALEEATRAASEAAAAAGAALVTGAGGTASGRALEAAQGIWEALLGHADARGAAILVAGSRGRGPIRAILLGSVAEGLLRHSRRPLLLVPHERTRR